MTKKKIALIGCGYWGPNYIRVLQQFPQTELVLICDKDEKRVASLQSQFSNYAFSASSDEAFSNPGIDAVIIATPVASHAKLVEQAIRSGKDVLCEKPLSLHPAEVRELHALAKEKNRILLTGHIYLFHPSVAKLKELISESDIGRVHYITSARTNLGPIRSDVNVVGDLAAHDISILYYLLGSAPESVSAYGGIYIQPNVHDVAFATIRFPNNIIAHLNLSWLAPRKYRFASIVSERKMITWDDLDPSEPIRVYDKSARHDVHYKDYKEFHAVSLKEGNVVIPKVVQQEPLKAEVQYFLSVMENRSEDDIHRDTAFVVANTIRAIDESMKQNGKQIFLS